MEPNQPFLAYLDIDYSIFTAKNLQKPPPSSTAIPLITIQVTVQIVTMEYYAALSFPLIAIV